MSEPMSDTQIGVEILKQVLAFCRSHQREINGLIDGASSASMTVDYWDMDLFERIAPLFAARIAALEVERDAAVARAEAAEERGRKLFAGNVLLRNVKQVEAERVGERRATAAIVADLRANKTLRDYHWGCAIADRYERGEHLPSAGNAGEG